MPDIPDRVERVARAIATAAEWCWDDLREQDMPHFGPCREDFRVQARAAITAADGPNSVQVRDQMLSERYGSNRPRAQWDVT